MSPDSQAAGRAGHQATSASGFHRLFRSEGKGGAFGTIARMVDPDPPPGLDPFSFLCSDLLHHVSRQWIRVLRAADFTDVHCHGDPVWDAAYQAIHRTALMMPAQPGTDLAGLRGEARRRLPTAHLLRRIAVTAVRG